MRTQPVDISNTPLAESAPQAERSSRLSNRASLDDETFQRHLLDGVSRTFALTIPQLPVGLCHVVSNGYLLCRIVDTIEDEPALSADEKTAFCEQFVNVVRGTESAQNLSKNLAPRLSDATIPAEHELIRDIPRVIAITHAFDAPQRKALERCISIMADGMARFQREKTTAGLADQPEMDRYCYHVAGVVGEMLTALFCHHSPKIAQHEDRLMSLAVSFGQGLQMTNILKDIWDDLARDACWLPREVFANEGFDLDRLADGHTEESFQCALGHLVGVAHSHLRNALEYVMLIPRGETGIRNFCLWAIGMAVLTLRKINANRAFSSGDEVKITRRAVENVVIASRFSSRSNLMLKTLFRLAGNGLPPPQSQS